MCVTFSRANKNSLGSCVAGLKHLLNKQKKKLNT